MTAYGTLQPPMYRRGGQCLGKLLSCVNSAGNSINIPRSDLPSASAQAILQPYDVE
jgi:hypothetical protein